MYYTLNKLKIKWAKERFGPLVQTIFSISTFDIGFLFLDE